MEYRLSVDGDPITDWERVRAADVALWKRSFVTAERTIQSIDAESRQIPVVVETPDVPGMDVLSKATKAEIRLIAEGLGIDPPKAATRPEMIALIREV